MPGASALERSLCQHGAKRVIRGLFFSSQALQYPELVSTNLIIIHHHSYREA